MLPKSLPILGRTYRIRRKRMRDYGVCDFSSGTIYLRSGMNDEAAEQVLLHEVVHAVLHESGQHFQWSDAQTEALVVALENGLWRAGWRLSGQGRS